jgi:hypothetical protein
MAIKDDPHHLLEVFDTDDVRDVRARLHDLRARCGTS